jgi:tRNA-Thr(GGU) m(6)t(6)A37 methyltransferase TsaA
MKIELTPVAYVKGGRAQATDDDWQDVNATIQLDESKFSSETIEGLDGFSHIVVVYLFHKVDPEKVERRSRPPRNNPAWPKVGIFAQRGRNRPNRIGVSVCKVIAVHGTHIEVRGLDAVDGTPVLDIKPYMSGFDPRGPVREPSWAKEIMAEYW